MLPAVTLAIFQLTLIMRLVRAEMLEVLRTDYIKFARARGLPDRAIHFGHALKNTLVPVMTIIGLQLGTLIAFSIITETVFQWPGMGLLFIQAVTFADIPVMAAYLCLIALIFVVINLVVDLLYFAVDPRLRVEQRRRTLMLAPRLKANGRAFAHIAQFHPELTALAARPACAPRTRLRGGLHRRAACRRRSSCAAWTRSIPASARPAWSRVIRGQRTSSGRMVGLRADMDALTDGRAERLRLEVVQARHDARLRP